MRSGRLLRARAASMDVRDQIPARIRMGVSRLIRHVGRQALGSTKRPKESPTSAQCRAGHCRSRPMTEGCGILNDRIFWRPLIGRHAELVRHTGVSTAKLHSGCERNLISKSMLARRARSKPAASLLNFEALMMKARTKRLSAQRRPPAPEEFHRSQRVRF